ncbi:hypothetical protein WJ73_19595 [Burkholderia ubonensis]|nr:hypothetical protein WJ73_19595 [Burkholderia ubonensis]
MAQYGDYFKARLDNGGIRIGLRGCECFDFPPTCPEYGRVLQLEQSQIEAAHDEFMGKYIINHA